MGTDPDVMLLLVKLKDEISALEDSLTDTVNRVNSLASSVTGLSLDTQYDQEREQAQESRLDAYAEDLVSIWGLLNNLTVEMQEMWTVVRELATESKDE